MDSWTKGPFSANPSYAGVRLKEGTLEASDGKRAVRPLLLADVRRLSLERGNAAERLGVALGVAGLVLVVGLGWLAKNVAEVTSATGSVNALMASLAVSGGGLALVARALRRRYFLSCELASGTRKVVFGSGAEPRGLSVFFAFLKKRGVTVELPADFASRSRFAPGAVPPGLRRLERQLSESAQLESFSLCAKDDALFELTTAPFANWLEQYLAQGATILDRQTLLCGQHLLLCEVDGGHLTLLAHGAEPDQWSVDLTFPLVIRLRQQLVAASFGLQPEPPNPQLLITVEQAAGKGPVLMSRRPRDEEQRRQGHSGWFVTSLRKEASPGDKGEHIRLTVADFGTLRPDLLELLALPVDHSVRFVGSKPEVRRGEQPLAPEPGSYMHCKQNALPLPAHLSGTA